MIQQGFEETVCKPEPSPQHLSAYGILKLTTEKLCLMYYHHYELPVTSFRIEVVFSDHESLLSALNSKYIDKVLKGEDIEVVNGEGCASVHVDEVVNAFSLATLNDKAYSHVFNVSNPTTYITHQELYQFIIQLTGSKSKNQSNSEWATYKLHTRIYRENTKNPRLETSKKVVAETVKRIIRPIKSEKAT